MFVRLIRPAVSLLVLMTLLLGSCIRWSITGVAQAGFPAPSCGQPDLSRRQAHRIGADRPELLGSEVFLGPAVGDHAAALQRPRPRAGSNLGPLNPGIARRGQGAMPKRCKMPIPDNRAPIPVDLVTASASGLDPDISPAAARYQAARVARARNAALASVDTLT